jgi:inorganic pyrophosphatase
MLTLIGGGRYAVRMVAELIEVLVEIPRGSRNKYEYHRHSGRFTLDRVLYSAIHYPADYGFINGTLNEHGDPLDALVVVHEPTFPGCHIMARPIGLLDMADEGGPDPKILAVPLGDPRFRSVRGLRHLDPHWLREIENFFVTYKALEAGWSEVREWHGTATALRVVAESRQRFERQREAGTVQGR